MTTETSPTTRRCIGSSRFGIEAHEADASDFRVQPSQKDGLGWMCKPHWRQYTNALRKAAVERMTAEGEVAPAPEPVADPDVAPEPAPQAIAEPEAMSPRRSRRAKTPVESESAAT